MPLTISKPTPFAGVNATYWKIGSIVDDLSSLQVYLNGFLDASHTDGQPLIIKQFILANGDYQTNMTLLQIEAYIIAQPDWLGAIQS